MFSIESHLFYLHQLFESKKVHACYIMLSVGLQVQNALFLKKYQKIDLTS